MNQTTSKTNNEVNPSVSLSWVSKIKYLGTGMVVGIIVAPLVRELLTKIKPKIDEVFEDLTGKAEGYVEKASDILFKAKEYMQEEKNHTHHHDAKAKRDKSTATKDSDYAV